MSLFSDAFGQRKRKKLADDVVNPSYHPHQYMQADLQREYLVVTPPGMRKDQKYPCVFVFHGGGGTAQSFAKKSNWDRVSGELIVVFLQATSRCLKKDGQEQTGNYWLTPAKRDLLCDDSAQYDDLDYMDGVIDAVLGVYPVDANQLFATGFSNGLGFILHNVMPQRPERFEAFGGVGSLAWGWDPYTLPVLKKPFFMMIGQNDDRFLQHSSQEAFELSKEAILGDTVLSTHIQYVTTLLGLDPDQSEVRTPKNAIRLVYRYPMEEQGLFIFELLEGVGHAFPSNGRQHNGHDAAKKLWRFFKWHEQMKGK